MRTKGALIRYKALGKTNVKIPELGIGTWKMGSSPELEKEAIQKAVSLGMGLVDTAEMYGNEAMVGAALKSEDDFFLATKVSPHHFKYDDVIRACKSSAAKLGVKAIDLYQLHWPSGSVPIGETMSAMERLVDKGLVKNIGISNFSIGEMRAAQQAMKKYEIVSNQVEYSLLVREIDGNGLAKYCKENKITIIAYSPIARGAILNGKESLLHSVLDQIARKHGKTPAQVALNYAIFDDNVVAIPKSSSPLHVAENAGASGWKMTFEERKMLEDAAVGKRSIARGIKPFVSKMGFLSGAYQGVSSFRNRNAHRSSRTTKSSKK